jgi:hypothetical protein
MSETMFHTHSKKVASVIKCDHNEKIDQIEKILILGLNWKSNSYTCITSL